MNVGFVQNTIQTFENMVTDCSISQNRVKKRFNQGFQKTMNNLPEYMPENCTENKGNSIKQYKVGHCTTIDEKTSLGHIKQSMDNNDLKVSEKTNIYEDLKFGTDATFDTESPAPVVAMINIDNSDAKHEIRNHRNSSFFNVHLGFQTGKMIRLESVYSVIKQQTPLIAILNSKQFKIVKNQQITEIVNTSEIISVHCMPVETNSGTGLFSFKINHSLDNNIPEKLGCPCNGLHCCSNIYGVSEEPVLYLWMLSFLKYLAPAFTVFEMKQYFYLGRCYIKTPLFNEWKISWIILSPKKELLFCCDDEKAEIANLRKMRSIQFDRTFGVPVVIVNCPPFLLSINPLDTTCDWYQMIQDLASSKCRTDLEDQQLTVDNVPVVVMKCLDFIFMHGVMTEGIYRKSGVTSKVKRLLDEFAKDAFAVDISLDSYDVHDVASTLKKFIRDLTEPLIGSFSALFLCISSMDSTDDKIQKYKKAIGQLSEIQYQTLQKIIKHLNFIQMQAAHNKMNTKNLAVVWGQNLLEKESTFQQYETVVVYDLITYCSVLFEKIDEECQKEQIFFNAIQKQDEKSTSQNNTDFIIWIKFVDKNGSDRDFRVTLTPIKTAQDVLVELVIKENLNLNDIILKEVIAGGDLCRHMYLHEIVLDTVLKWSKWGQKHSEKSYLEITSKNTFCHIDKQDQITEIRNFEVAYSDYKSKSLKPFVLKISNNKIELIKNTGNCSSLTNYKTFKNIMAYLGAEEKREMKNRFAVTLIDVDIHERLADVPFIGHILCVETHRYQMLMYSALLDCLIKSSE